jgi:hypothetical protein
MPGPYRQAGHLVRRFALLPLILGSTLTFSGCEPSPALLMSSPEPHPMRLSTPEPGFRLSEADRTEVLPGFDVEALERLLGMTRPDLRHEILKHFQKRKDGERLGMLVRVEDPDLQRVLEEVWAPKWDVVNATDAEIEANAFGYPGREIALQRRAARARAERGGSE